LHPNSSGGLSRKSFKFSEAEIRFRRKSMKREIKFSVLAALTIVMFWQVFVGSAYAIVNGVRDWDAHPYVGMMVFEDVNGDLWRCSGSLISPTVFLTAGHCTVDAVEAWISFDEDLRNVSYTDFPYHSTEFHTKMPYGALGPGLPGFAAGYDVGIVILDQPVSVDDVSEYALLPDSTLLESLPPMAGVTLVGYGVQWQERGKGITPPTSWRGLRVRMQADAEIIPSRDVVDDKYLKITANVGDDRGSTMFGDSGGPVLIGDTVVAVTSFGTSYNRGGVGYYSRVDISEVNNWIQGYLP